QLVGSTGRVIAVDLQQGMLDRIRGKIKGTEIEERIVLHKCTKNSIGISDKVDFVLLFYMVHELPDKDSFFSEIASIMKPTAQALIVEPPFHVSKSAFELSLIKAQAAGLKLSQCPKLFLNKTAILQKS
ncbi:MAG: class I SAM-dependent methyltransferase, partial [Desulfamplus sp.]|nr:class I SAM-dependent methyltransferase [Desulfamplus sp.]